MKKKVLYFVDGPSPTQAQKDFAKSNGFSFRNAAGTGEQDFVERCDFVLGEVPAAYSKFPKHELADKAPKADAKPVVKK
jgi:hypothetical protein